MSVYLPQLETGEFLEHQELQPYWLDPTKDYPEPHYLLEYNGVGFSPIGGLQAITGPKKNGKTFVIAQLMAAILNSDSERMRAKLPGLCSRQDTIDWLGHEPSVLYVDTEMEELNSAKVLRRVHWLCGWPQDKPNPRFNVLWLRNVADEMTEDGTVGKRAYQKRLELILKAIEAVNPDAVFIDGIRDIIGDFNDNQESASLVNKLMALASNRSICVWSVLHFNPKPGNETESKMRGHLGTELGNKVSDTFVSVKKKTKTGITFTVSQLDARGKDVEDWTFEITDDAGSLGIPRITEAPAVPDNNLASPLSDLAKMMRKLIVPPQSLNYTKIRDGVKNELHCGSKKADRLIHDAINYGLIEKYLDRYMLNEERCNEIENPDPFA